LLHVISGFPKLLKLKADEVLAKDSLAAIERMLSTGKPAATAVLLKKMD
jgi:hypothetical protein